MSGVASRLTAVQTLHDILQKGRSFSQTFPHYSQHLEPRDRALAQQICFGVLRELPSLNWLLQQLLQKPFKGNKSILHEVLLVGAYQLVSMNTAEHGSVSATVEVSKKLGHKALSGVINGVLRNLLRQHAQLQQKLAQAQAQDRTLQSNHPRWLVERIEAAYPQQAQQILSANHQHPPLWLRVNRQHPAAADYPQRLHNLDIGFSSSEQLPSALKLDKPMDVTQLPDFATGAVSVQDIAAQHAAFLLAAQAHERVLDCCAAPGGKTAHLLEQTPGVQVTAVEADPKRAERIGENLDRLGLTARLKVADARDLEQWWDGQQFDRILLDAPCSATGVIRRHPDIKWLRRATDIAELASLQASILDALWPTLKPGGRLLYATCSILPEENSEQIQAFVARHSDAIRLATSPSGGIDWQWLPGDYDGDGFYYALLEKQA